MFFTNPGDNKPSDSRNFQVFGTVVEEATGEPLAGAKIKIVDLNKEIYTDFDGNFLINDLKPGEYNLNISFVSYKTKELRHIQLNTEHNSLLVSLK